MIALAKFAGGAAALYLLLLGALYLVQRSLIYIPDRSRPAPAAFGVAEMVPVTLRTADGLALVAWWRPAGAADLPVMVYFPGNAGHLGHRAEKVRPYLDRGWGVLLVAWRGYGGNPGRPSEQGLYADGRAALAFVRAQGIAPARLVLYGESLGSAVAVRLAAEAEAAAGALVLEAPFSSLVDVAAAHYPLFPVRPLVRDRFDSMARIAAVGMPLLVIHGMRDSVVPVRFGRRLLAAARPPKEGAFIAGAGHNDLYDFGAATRIVAFVRRHVGG